MFTSGLCDQQTLGSLVGTVADSTGAIVSNATVTATNDQTAVVRTTKTNSSGAYGLSDLAPGDLRHHDYC
jgi:hypothetical protein